MTSKLMYLVMENRNDLPKSYRPFSKGMSTYSRPARLYAQPSKQTRNQLLQPPGAVQLPVLDR